MSQKKSIATVLGISILFAILIIAVYLVMHGFKAYADTVSGYEQSVLPKESSEMQTEETSQSSTSESADTCFSCSQ